MDGQLSSSLTIYLMLFLSSLLATLDIIELSRIFDWWKIEIEINSDQFNECIKWDLITRTSFNIFSLISSISAFTLTFLIIFDANVFLEKILSTYLYFNYLVFGPIMLAFSIIALENWNFTILECDKKNFHNKLLSYSNILCVSGTFMISFFISITISIYKTINLYIDSNLKRPEGSPLLRKIFRFILLKSSNPSNLIRLTRASEY